MMMTMMLSKSLVLQVGLEVVQDLGIVADLEVVEESVVIKGPEVHVEEEGKLNKPEHFYRLSHAYLLCCQKIQIYFHKILVFHVFLCHSIFIVYYSFSFC